MLLLLVTLNALCCLLALWLCWWLRRRMAVPAQAASFAACLAAEAPSPPAAMPVRQGATGDCEPSTALGVLFPFTHEATCRLMAQGRSAPDVARELGAPLEQVVAIFQAHGRAKDPQC